MEKQGMRSTILIGLRAGNRCLQGCAMAVLIACGGAACAASSDPPLRHAIHQPAQPLADSLRAVARQTGASLVFDPRAVQGLEAASISGQYSAAEAIGKLLNGTGLVLTVQPDGAMVVRPPQPQPRSRSVGTAAAVTLADASGAAVGAGQPTAAAGGDIAEGGAGQKIEITGSRLRRIDGDTALPVNVYSAQEIERSGQPSLGRFLASLNEVSMGQGEGAFSSNTQGQGNVQLRGLPLGSTLVLLNGRRIQAVGSSAGNFFNLNLIPLAAVERIEVVPVGSSAVYGGDALGGVVNVILKKAIDGQTFSLRGTSGQGFGDGGMSLGMGGRGADGAWMLIGSYQSATPLKMEERDFFRDADYRRFNGPDARARNCSPGTVSSTTGANLPGLASTFAAIPVTQAGQPLSIASFQGTAGQANLCPNLAANGATALVHGSETLALHGSGQYSWAGLDGFVELTHVQERVQGDGLGLNFNDLVVPASNPNNPFGVAVRVTARLGSENGREAYARSTNFTRALLGVRGLLGGWDYEVAASVSRDKGDRVLANNTVNTAARTAALATSDPSASLNPFATGRAASDAVLRGIWSDTLRYNFGRKDLLGGFARGPVLTLPAGDAEAIVGVEAARDRYDTIQGTSVYRTSRRTEAAYAEVRLPVLRGRAEGERDWTLAALTLAGRGDRYGDFGSATTYQAGLELRPARSMLLRGTMATSFKPPTLLQANVNETVFPIELARLTDPRRGNEPVTGGTWVRTANPDLKPETGKAYALGLAWEPAAATGLRVGATAWQVRIDGMIGILLSQVVVNNEALLPGFVLREPSVNGQPGRITRLNMAESNFGYVETSGFDFELSHTMRSSIGRWALGASASRTTDYEVAIAPGVAATSRVGKRFGDYWAPRWKARLSLGWEQGPWSAGLASRYVAAYDDAGAPPRRLGNSWTHDLSGRIDLKRLGLELGPAKAATLSLSLVNVGDVQPQFVNDSPYYDITLADWRGRHASLRFSLDW
jgi:iron complex outermembrane recepter protein